MGLIKERDTKEEDFKDWFKKNKFKQKELEEIDNLLINDILPEDKKNKNETLIQEKTVLYNFLFEIYQEKYSNENYLN